MAFFASTSALPNFDGKLSEMYLRLLFRNTDGTAITGAVSTRILASQIGLIGNKITLPFTRFFLDQLVSLFKMLKNEVFLKEIENQPLVVK